MPPSGDEHERFLPRPPIVRTTADFVVIVFVLMIATILTAFTLTVVIGGIFTNNDMSSYVTMLTDIMGAILGALIGFIAGKGAAQAETASNGNVNDPSSSRMPDDNRSP